LPAGAPWHDKVDVPEPPVMLVEDKVHDRLVELVVTARPTVPEKPLSGATVMVEVPVAPALTLTLVGLAVTVKSCTWNTTVAV
jgi:hypothetical protein